MSLLFSDLISTQRLQLRSLAEGDLPAAQVLFTHPLVSKTYMLPEFQSPEEVVRLFEKIRTLSRDKSRFVYGICLHDELIGLVNEVEKSETEMELGYAIHPDFHSRGYATEMLNACIEELFAHGFSTVKAGAFVENRASQRVMEKCGMIKTEKTEEITYRGCNHTCVCYEIKRASL